VAAVAQALPFADGSFDAAWCLGVLCTTTEKAAALAELRRVLPTGGRLGLLVFVADGPLTLPAPDGNAFPSEAETRALLEAAGFDVVDTAGADLGDSPPEWQERADAVDAEIARRHGRDPAWQAAEEQSGRVGRLLGAGQLRPWLAVAVAR
jgi:SAM-dependent methyltransferase